MIVTGIGTRDLPTVRNQEGVEVVDPRLLFMVSCIGQVAKQSGWILRSGGAKGMDAVFEHYWSDRKEIYIPNDGWRGRYDGVNGAIVPNACYSQAEAIAKSIHPNWKACDASARKLHSRNINQVLGELLIEPADVCVYYANVDPETNEPTGGTRTAVMLCRERGIPNFNLKITEEVIAMASFLELPHDFCS